MLRLKSRLELRLKSQTKFWSLAAIVSTAGDSFEKLDAHGLLDDSALTIILNKCGPQLKSLILGGETNYKNHEL